MTVLAAVLGLIAAFGSEQVWVRVLGVLIAVLSGLAAVLQYWLSRELRIVIEPGDWSYVGNEFVYVIDRNIVGGRRNVALYQALHPGGEEQVFGDVVTQSNGSLKIASGSRVQLIAYVTLAARPTAKRGQAPLGCLGPVISGPLDQGL